MNNGKSKLITILVIALLAFAFNANQTQAEEQLGQEQEEDGHKTFLRFSRVLLKRGQGSIDVDISYQNSKKSEAIFGANTSRGLGLTMTARISPMDNVEVYVRTPFEYRQQTQDYYLEETSDTEDNAGIGDIHTGVKFLVSEESNGWPELVGSLDVGIPTSESQYNEPLGVGTGHYSLGGSLMFVKTVHPATLFGSIGYNHSFARNKDGQDIQPGSSINYGFGFGFALSYNLTLSSQFSGSYLSKSKVDGEDVPFSSAEPMIIKNTLSYSIDPITSIDPSISFGLNDDAPDTEIGLSFSRRF